MSRRKAKQADDNSADTKTDAKADSKAQKQADRKASKKSSPKGAGIVAQVRSRIAQLVWLVFVLCALLLAVGALVVALDANNQNSLVRFVLDGANTVELGIFSRKNGIKEFGGNGADVKNALLNWGLGAVAYLVVGRILDRVIRP